MPQPSTCSRGAPKERPGGPRFPRGPSALHRAGAFIEVGKGAASDAGPFWLQVDIAFTPEADFGPRGPNWRTAFGETVEVEVTPAQHMPELAGFAWLGALHARVCNERGKPWQAEWDIALLRENLLALACALLGYPTRFARGADLLPSHLTAPWEVTLVRSTDEAELRRALRAAGHGICRRARARGR